ncbi:MAG: SPOR domain-containing protein [Paludibacteraceae bacterium]|nr:SPOR domain-containing protein [Paludibacteraceae bacterium]
MEKIYEHIERLLNYHEYVVVPGLGGFVLQPQPARIEAGKIIAPYSTVSFNPLMQHADGLLAIEIARAESITYRQAMEMLNVQVNTMLDMLRNSKSLSMGRLGVFELNGHNAMLFTPATDLSFIPLNTGLQNIVIATPKAQKQTTVKVMTMPGRYLWRYAAAAVLVISMLFISPELNDPVRTESANLLSLSFLENELPEPTPEPVVIESDSVADPCPELVETVTETGEVENNDADLYHVIVASLPSQESADSYCETLKAENFECAHVLSKIKTYRVAVKSFDDRAEAIRFMEELRLTDERFETAWVLCK